MIQMWLEGANPSSPGEFLRYDALVPALGKDAQGPDELPEHDEVNQGRAEELGQGINDTDSEPLLKMVEALGLTVQDLMRVDTPGGASRVGGARMLVRSEHAALLYQGATGADNHWTLKWREDNTSTQYTMPVWLLPPRPLYWPQTNGPVLVECVDCRYWFKYLSSASVLLNVHSGSLTFDGRYLNRAGTGTPGSPTPAQSLGSVLAVVNALISALGLTIALPGGFNPSVEALLCLQNLVANFTGNAALLLDMMLAECGWSLQYLPSDATWQIVEHGDVTIMGTWMNATKRAHCGGVGGTSDDTATADPLLTLWNGQAEYVKNLGPRANRTITQQGFREGDAKFDNQSDAGDIGSISTPPSTTPVVARPLAADGCAWLRTAGVLPKVTTNLTGLYPWLTKTPTDLADYRQARWLQRAKICFGKTLFAGWQSPPRGSFRQTGCRWTIVDMGGTTGYAPVLITEAARDDWTLGQDGAQDMDPRSLILTRGNIFCTDLPGGGKMLAVAPPQMRLFWANIESSPVLCDGEWRAKYKWHESEPTQELTCGMDRWVPSYPMTRKWNADTENPNYAENASENANQFGVFLWPGVTIADYPNTVFTWKPIAAGGPVLMAELIPTVWPFSNYPQSPRPQYVFATNPAYDTACVTPS